MSASPGESSTLDDLVHHRLLTELAEGDVADRAVVARVVRELAPVLAADAADAVAARVLARVSGLGPLEPLMGDPAITEVMVNGGGRVWIERDGALVGTPLLLRIDEVELLIERVLAPLGRRVDPVSPMVDARLADGSRVNVVVPPLAVDGPCVTIRRFSVRALSLDDLAAPPVAELLRWAVSARSNVVVVGATGSGKTTLLNALAGEVGAAERIITVEDAAELRLPGPHVVRLEARPPSADGVGAVSLRDLVRNALRMRPDRVIVGEVRGPEALDMLQALNTGHDGSLSTCHANGPDDGLRRLETLVLTAGTGLPLDAVRDQLAAAVDLVIHVARGAGGARRVAAVTEVPPPEARGEGRLVGRLLTSVDGRRVVCRPTRHRRGSGSTAAAPAIDERARSLGAGVRAS